MTKAQARAWCRAQKKIIAAWAKEQRLRRLEALKQEVAAKKKRADEECKRKVEAAKAKPRAKKKAAPKKRAAPRPRRKAVKKRATPRPRKKAAPRPRKSAPAKPKKAARKRAPKRKAARKKASRKKASVRGAPAGVASSVRIDPRPAPAPRAPSLASRIISEALAIGGGRTNTRVRLKDLRLALQDVRRGELDEELLRLSDAGKLVLYRIDMPTDISHADHAAALMVGGHPRHIIYLDGRALGVDSSGFESDFRSAFADLVPRTRSGLVTLLDIRNALSWYGRREFDAGLRALRERSDDFALETFDGRHGQLDPAQLDAAIREGGRAYIFVKRRDL